MPWDFNIPRLHCIISSPVPGGPNFSISNPVFQLYTEQQNGMLVRVIMFHVQQHTCFVHRCEIVIMQPWLSKLQF